jgi:hypothetical protein
LNQEGTPRLRRLCLFYMLLGLISLGGTGCQGPSSVERAKELRAPTIVKEPARVMTRTFDPANPPSDMPPLASTDEIAQCESDFTANANLGGQAQRTDSTHAVITVRQINITLQLDVIIWVPEGVSQRVMEHEQGHRQISEYYYQTADKLAAQIAANYMGKQVTINGPDIDAAFHKALQDIGGEITGEYEKQLDPNPAQLLYDSITDHSRNDVAVQDAVDHAVKNVAVESSQPAGADPPGHQ